MLKLKGDKILRKGKLENEVNTYIEKCKSEGVAGVKPSKMYLNSFTLKHTMYYCMILLLVSLSVGCNTIAVVSLFGCVALILSFVYSDIRFYLYLVDRERVSNKN